MFKKIFNLLLALLFSATTFAQLPIRFVNNINTSEVHLIDLKANGTSATCNTCATELRTNIVSELGSLSAGQSLIIQDFANNSAGATFIWDGALCASCSGAAANAVCTTPNPSPPDFTHISFRIGPPYYSGFLQSAVCGPPQFGDSMGPYTATWVVTSNEILVTFTGP